MNEPHSATQADSNEDQTESVPVAGSFPDTLQTAWVAGGLSLVPLTVIASLLFDRSLQRLLVSDDAYLIAFVSSVPVTVIFAIGGIAGWLRRSRRAAWSVTAIGVVGFSGLLWALDSFFPNSEGAGIPTSIAAAIVVGSVFASFAFFVRGYWLRLTLSVVPHLSWAVGYMVARQAMAG